MVVETGGTAVSLSRSAGVVPWVNHEVLARLGELRRLMESATEADRDRLSEMTSWFDSYLARATPGEASELRRAVRRLWPVGARILMEEAESEDPEIAAGALLALEKIPSLREGGDN